MGLEFSWDPGKARRNRQKHGVAFDEAITVFDDPFSATVPDPDHSHAEDRFVIIGQSIGSDCYLLPTQSRQYDPNY